MRAMPISRRAQRLLAWIASFAILLTALAPTISHALNLRAPATNWMEVCSVNGAKLVAVAMDDSESRTSPDGELPGSHLLKHCPYCSLHSTSLGMPPAPPASPALLDLQFQVPELFLLAPRTLFAWASAQARAPPR
jgi:hypothetical protein